MINNDITNQFEEFVDIGVPKDVILDCEMISLNEEGKPSFEQTMSRFQSKRSPFTCELVVFDVLYHGKRITHYTLLQRKEILETLFSENELIKRVRWQTGQGKELFQLCQKEKLEGIVCKRLNSQYHEGKRPVNTWYKAIVYERETLFIIGYLKDKVGWLLGKVTERGI